MLYIFIDDQSEEGWIKAWENELFPFIMYLKLDKSHNRTCSSNRQYGVLHWQLALYIPLAMSVYIDSWLYWANILWVASTHHNRLLIGWPDDITGTLITVRLYAVQNPVQISVHSPVHIPIHGPVHTPIHGPVQSPVQSPAFTMTPFRSAGCN